MISMIPRITFNNSTLNDVQGNYYNYHGITPGERGTILRFMFMISLKPTDRMQAFTNCSKLHVPMHSTTRARAIHRRDVLMARVWEFSKRYAIGWPRLMGRSSGYLDPQVLENLLLHRHLQKHVRPTPC